MKTTTTQPSQVFGLNHKEPPFSNERWQDWRGGSSGGRAGIWFRMFGVEDTYFLYFLFFRDILFILSF